MAQLCSWPNNQTKSISTEYRASKEWNRKLTGDQSLEDDRENESFRLTHLKRPEKRRSFNSIILSKSPRLESSDANNVKKRASFLNALSLLRQSHNKLSTSNETKVKSQQQQQQQKPKSNTFKGLHLRKLVNQQQQQKIPVNTVIEIEEKALENVCDLMMRQELVSPQCSLDDGIGSYVPVHNIPQDTMLLARFLQDQEDAVNSSFSIVENSLDMRSVASNSQMQLDQYSDRIFYKLVMLDKWAVKAYREDFLVKNDIQVSLRGTLMDWLIKVQQYLRLRTESLHLAALLTDRYSWLKPISNASYQLVAITALFMATKYVERFPPKLKSLCHLTDNSFKPGEILHFERHMLMALDFRLDLTLPHHLLYYGLYSLTELEIEKKMNLEMLCLYLLDATLSEFDACRHTALVKVTAALLLAKRLLLGPQCEKKSLNQCLSPSLLGCPSEQLQTALQMLQVAESDLTSAVKCYTKFLKKVQSATKSVSSGKTTLSYDAAFLKFNHAKYNSVARSSSVVDFDFGRFETRELPSLVTWYLSPSSSRNSPPST